ncbi:uncharacterized protein TNCV_1994691 [Trichonephila clavipes]|nr:uncharacterized protein TNCV_1994691 [Trichonephila clavipes]
MRGGNRSNGKLYFRLVDVGALLGRSKVYEFAKRFDNLIQGKDVLPAHKQYPIITQKSKLVTPDVVFNILNAELSSLATSFAISLHAGSALVENPSNLLVESYKTSPVLHVQDSPVPNSILVRLWVQTFIQKIQDMRRMQNGSKPSIQMVYEGCLRAERPAQRPERNCQVIYSQFGLAIHQNGHQARRRFVEWARNEIAIVPDFHKRILFSDEAHFWLNGYVNKQNCRISSEANIQVYVETPLHPEKLTVWCALWAGRILLKKR